MATTKNDQKNVTVAKVEASKVAEEKKVEVKSAAPKKETAAKKTTTAKKATTAKTETAKAATAKKETTAKKTTIAKKTTTAKKAVVKTSQVMYIQYLGKEISTDEINAKVLAAVGKKNVKELNIYVKPEDNKIYFTADGIVGSVDL